MVNYFWLNLCSLQNTERAIPENIRCLLKHSFKLEIKKRVWCSGSYLVQWIGRPGVDSLQFQSCFFINLKLELRSKQKIWQRVDLWSCLCLPLFMIKLLLNHENVFLFIVLINNNYFRLSASLQIFHCCVTNLGVLIFANLFSFNCLKCNSLFLAYLVLQKSRNSRKLVPLR